MMPLDYWKVWVILMMTMTMRDTICKAIEHCGMTRYELSKRTGVTQGMLSKFVHGKCSMTVDLLDKLAGPLGLRLVVKRPSKRKGR